MTEEQGVEDKSGPGLKIIRSDGFQLNFSYRLPREPWVRRNLPFRSLQLGMWRSNVGFSKYFKDDWSAFPETSCDRARTWLFGFTAARILRKTPNKLNSLPSKGNYYVSTCSTTTNWLPSLILNQKLHAASNFQIYFHFCHCMTVSNRMFLLACPSDN